jgi:hypothetical protein
LIVWPYKFDQKNAKNDKNCQKSPHNFYSYARIINIFFLFEVVNIALAIYRLVKSSEGFELAKPSPQPFDENFLKEHQFVSQLGNPVSMRLTFDKPPSNGAVVKIVRKGVSSPFFDQDKLGNWVIKWNGNVYTRS